MADHWTTADIAHHFGWASPDVARKTIQRWGLKPATDTHGHTLRHPHTDAKLYDPTQVLAAKAAAPGRGHHRTRTTAEETQ